MNKKAWKSFIVYLIVFLMFLSAVQYFTRNGTGKQEEVVFNQNYSELIAGAKAGKLKAVEITSYDNYQEVQGKTKDGKTFKMTIPKESNTLESTMLENKVKVKQNPTPQPSPLFNLLGTLLPILLLIGVVFYFMNQAQGGGAKVNQFGKSKAKMQLDDKKRVTFRDVAGADEVKEELEEVVGFLKDPRKYREIGAKIPKGVLLFGPPGTGKTLLARAVAGEAGVPFFSISGSDFVEMFVGVGASRVRDLFDQAKKNSPCIIFIDEIDAVGRQRGAGLGGGHDEREQTLNQLLVEMDGFDDNEGIIILAATNRPDILDPALLRPGRFDRQVTVGRPDVRGREEILKVHVRNKPLANDVDLAVIAKQTAGFTGADLANLINEAALLSARENLRLIGQAQLEESIERVIAGPEKKNRAKISEAELRLVSYHEAGHAVIGHILPECDPIHKVSIVPRGGAGGYTMSLPVEDRNYLTRTHLLHEVTMMLGGRVAEALVLGEISSGASNDLERATNLIRQMVMRWGMSDTVGTVVYGEDEEQVFLGRDLGHTRNYSEAYAVSIDNEVKRIMDECYAKAMNILTEYRKELDVIAQALLEKEVINAYEFKGLMAGKDLATLEKEQEAIYKELEYKKELQRKGIADNETKLLDQQGLKEEVVPPPEVDDEVSSETPKGLPSNPDKE